MYSKRNYLLFVFVIVIFMGITSFFAFKTTTTVYSRNVNLLDGTLSDNNYLSNITGIEETFDRDTLSYTKVVDYDVNRANLTATCEDANASLLIDNYELNYGPNVLNITVTAEDGSVRVYTVTVVRNMMSYDDHTAKLRNIIINDGKIDFDKYFDSSVYEYNIEMSEATVDLDIETVTYDDDADVMITGETGLFNSSGTVTIYVTEPNSVDRTYRINYTRISLIDLVGNNDYVYTGSEEEYVVPFSGIYRLETWGAQGGDANTFAGGRGGYSSADIFLRKGQKIYINVGREGQSISGCISDANNYTPYNGGGTASCQANNYFGAGSGGATHMALVSGELKNLFAKKNEILVVAGGGGAAAGNLANDNSTNGFGGAGGGVTGLNGTNQTNSRTYGSGGSQTGVGNTGNDGGQAIKVAAGFGQGCTANASYGGYLLVSGGAGYYGGGCGTHSGGGGGSGYVIDETLATGYRMEVVDSISLNGTQQIPKYTDGTNAMGNSGNGYARIKLVSVSSNNSYLSSLSTDVGTWNKTFDPFTYEYNIELDTYDKTVDISAIAMDAVGASITGTGTEIFDLGETRQIIVAVTPESGEVRNYTLNISRKDLPAGTHSSKIDDLIINGGNYETNPIFTSNRTEYDLEIDKIEADVAFEYTLYDSNATVTILNNHALLEDTGIITITVTSPGTSPTTYTFNYHKNDKETSFDVPYSGNMERIVVPYSGKYKIQAWGAQGGYRTNSAMGGLGGYSEGIVQLYKNDILYVYSGGAGNNGTCVDSVCRGGFNGGGDRYAFKGGGGASDVRINADSYYARVIVAGGGGSDGAAGYGGGAGGGTYGISATQGCVWGISGYCGTPTFSGSDANTTATSRSETFIGQGAFIYGGFGFGGNGTYHANGFGGGGGGGWYGGTGTAPDGSGDDDRGGGGGSGFVLTEETYENVPTGYLLDSRYFMEDAQTIAGNQSFINVLGTGNETGHTNNGYVKITNLSLSSKNNYLTTLTSDYGVWDKSFDPTVHNYNITLDKYDNYITLEGELYDELSTVSGLGTYRLAMGETLILPVSVTAESGDVRTYTLTIYRKTLDPGEHSTKLEEIMISDEYELNPSFVSSVYDYNIVIGKADMEIVVEYIKYDPDATVTVTGNGLLLYNTGTVTITVTEPHTTTTVYRIHYEKDTDITLEKDFEYTGSYEEFKVKQSGLYKLQTWGAQGGGKQNGQQFDSSIGAMGGYSYSETPLFKGDIVYVYVGEMGKSSGALAYGGFNGGGMAYGSGDGEPANGGGGATDMRINSHSVYSRVIVAGGGGGAGEDGGDVPGFGGGIYGGTSSGMGTPAYIYYSGTGGVFGYGANTPNDGGGGGGGWYGGGTLGGRQDVITWNDGSDTSGGAGGSGWVYTNENYDIWRTNSEQQANNYLLSSKYISTNAYTIAGNAEMPSPIEGVEVGHSGNGYAKIEAITLYSKNNYLDSITATRGTFDKPFESIIQEYTLTIGKFENYVDISAEAIDETAIVSEVERVYLDTNEQKDVVITVTSTSGDTRNYTVHVVREGLAPGEHTSYLSSLIIAAEEGDQYSLSPEFISSHTEYDLPIARNEISLSVTCNPIDEEATCQITGHQLLFGETGTITVRVSEPHSSDTTYVMHYTKDALEPEYSFEHTGSREVMTITSTGYYKIQAWGAQGGYRSSVDKGGRGGYSEGNVLLHKGDVLYIYTGGSGNSGTCENSICRGGFNGGGDRYGFKGGGGASDVRINEDSLYARVIVAGGGGSDGSPSYGGGAGGGLTGLAVLEGCTWNGNFCGIGGNQTYAGAGVGYTATERSEVFTGQTYAINGGFGFGGNGTAHAAGYGGAGGGGWYGGSGTAPDGSVDDDRGGGGGSGYVYTSETSSSVPQGYLLDSSYYMVDAFTLDGAQGFESVDGGTETGHLDNGYVRITPQLKSKNDYLVALTSDYGTFDKTFEPTVNNYTLVLNKYDTQFTLSGTLGDSTSKVVGFKKYEIALGETKVIPVTITSASGTTRVYTVTATRPALAPGEHSSKLATLVVGDDRFPMNPEFVGYVTEYSIEIPETVIAMNVETTTYDPDAKVTVTGNGYIKPGQNGLITITVTNPYCSPTVYKVQIIREGVAVDKVFDYDYTGEYETFEAPVTGYYQLETWGAEGSNRGSQPGGRGGYSTGKIFLRRGQLLYLYVGASGKNGGWNGGGYQPQLRIYGGGASDIRLVEGEWNDQESLLSRIIVAGGGGSVGASSRPGGSGGGYYGVTRYESYGTGGGGGTPTEGGVYNGTFGIGGNGISQYSGYGGAGGGGWYGGGGVLPDGSVDDDRGGGGGSGFVLMEDTYPEHLEGYSVSEEFFFEEGESINGDSQIPSKSSGYSTGNTGDGHIRITKIDDPSEDNLLNSITVKYDNRSVEYTPEFDVAINDYYAEFEVDQTEVYIAAKPSDSKATINGLGTFDVLAGENVYPITVVAENGDIRVYNVHVIRPASTEEHPNDIIINGLVPSLCSRSEEFCHLNVLQNGDEYVEVDGFDENIEYYYITVPSRIKQLYFEVEKAHKYQSVSGDGKATLEGGLNIITIDIESEDEENHSVYVYNVIRDMSGNNDIDVLNILDPNIDILFDPDVTDYYFTVPNSYTSFDILENNEVNADLEDVLQIYLHADDDQAEVYLFEDLLDYDTNHSGDLETGMNAIPILVVARNGDARIYTLNVYREKNSNAFLDNLYIEANGERYDVTPEFNFLNSGYYYVTVPNTASTINVVATPQATTSTVTGAGSMQIPTGSNYMSLLVTSEKGEVEYYYLSVYRLKNNNTYLSSISVNSNSINYGITPDVFDKDTLTYDITVPEGTDSIDITATVEVETSSYRLLDNNYIRVGVNEKRIMVVAEDGSSRIYTIRITRPASTNSNLLNLILTNGDTTFDLNPTYDKDTHDYTLAVENKYSYVNVQAILEDSLSSVSGTGRYYLTVGENSIRVTVTSESGEENVYVVTVIREPNSDAHLSSISINRGTLDPVFNEDVLEYNVTLPNEYTNIRVTGYTKVSTTSVTGNDTYDLEVGTNVINLVTLAEDGTTTLTYKINVVRELSTNNYLSNLILKEASLSPKFNKNTNSYSAVVPYSVSKATFIITLENEDASYEISDDKLEEGENEITITVTSASGSIKVYTVNITRLTESQSKNTRLTSITVSEGTLSPVFDPETMYYEVEVPYGITNLDVSAVLESSYSSIVGEGRYNLEVGENLIQLRVTAPEGTYRDYQINVNRLKNTESRLSSLVINGHSITPNFNSDVYEYSLTTTLNELTFANITPIDSNATYVVTGNYYTNKGDYVMHITVTAANGVDTSDYVFNITKDEGNNNNLKLIEIDGFELLNVYGTPIPFNKTTTLYYVNVDKDTNAIAVNAIPEDPLATVNGDGMVNLVPGINYVIITCTSESGNDKAYTLVVNKAKSSNNYLVDLNVINGVMTPSFDKLINTYNVTVPYDEEMLDLDIMLEDNNASYTVLNNDLSVGNNVVTVRVTAEDGSTNDYILNVTREQIVSALLKNIEIDNYELTPSFNKNITNYSLTIDNEVNELDMVITTLDPDATYVVTGNENLVVGNNTITILVTSSDGVKTETYTLDVNKQAYSNTYLDYLYTSSGDVTPTFVKTTHKYSIDVDNSVTSIELFAEAELSSATVTGTGEFELNPGENKFTITVTSTSGVSRRYYVTVNRLLNDDNYLLSLNAKIGNVNYELSPDFDPNTLEYNIVVPVGSLSINLNGTVSELAKVSGLGNVQLVAGDNEKHITVKSESGIDRVYTIHIYRTPSDNNQLTDIIPSSGTLDPVFVYGNNEYQLKLDSSVAMLSFTYSKEDLNSIVTGIDLEIVPDGESTRTITVQSESGDINVYTITIFKDRTDNAKLKALSIIGGYEFEEEFDPEVYEYHVTLPNSMTHLHAYDINAIADDSNSRITKESSVALSTTVETTYTITVTAADRFTTLDYRIIVSREKGSTSTLDNLTVNIGTLTETYNKDIREYEWIVPKNISNILSSHINYVLTDPNSTISIPASTALVKDGNDQITIRVTSEDETNYTDYVLHISLDLSTITTLSNIEVDKGYMEPEFDSETYSYDVHIYEDETEIYVTATSESDTSTVVSGTGLINLPDPQYDDEIVIESESGSQEVYTLHIYKDIKRDTGVIDIEFNDLPLDECINGKCIMTPSFSEEVEEYSITVPYIYEELDLLVTPKNNQQVIKKYVGETEIDTYSLPVGDTLVRVEVYDGMGLLTNTYSINVTRPRSNITTLESLTVTSGSDSTLINYELLPEFDKNINEYSIVVDNSIDEVTINAVATESLARVRIQGYNYLEVGNNVATIVVTALDGTVRTYIINIEKEPLYNSYLSNITVSTGVFWNLSPKFKRTVYDYTVVVPGIYERVTIEAIPSDPNTVVTGTGEFDVHTGNNVFTLVGTSMSGDESTYTLNVVREVNRNVNLESLSVLQGEISPAFDRTIIKYDVEVDDNVDSLSITAIPEDRNATVMITGNDNLSSGDNLVNVIVFSEDKSASKTYKIFVNKALSSNYYPSNIIVSSEGDDETINHNLSPTFDKQIREYEVEVDSNVEMVNVAVPTEKITTTVSGDGDYYLGYGDNVIDLVMTAENGNTDTYRVHIYRNYDLRLDELLSDIGTLEPDFDPDTLEYNINLNHEDDRIVFIALPKLNAVNVTGSGTYNLNTGENVFEFTTTSPDNKSLTYKVIVNREKSDNTNITDITVHEGSLKVVTDASKEEQYEVNVRNNVTSLTVDVSLEDPAASYELIDNSFSGEGDHLVTLRVTAENGDTRDYKIMVHVQPDSYFSSRLLSLTLSNGVLNPDFDPDITYYATTVANSITQTTISAVMENIDATITGTGLVSLDEGRNVFYVTVTNQDKVSTTYVIVIYREENSDASLSNLILKKADGTGIAFSPIFNKTVTDYQATIPSDCNDIYVNYVTSDPNSTVKVEGNLNLQPGDNEVTVTVTAPDGVTESVYKIVVTKPLSANNYLKELKIGSYTLDPTFVKTNNGPYKINVASSINNLYVEATPEDNKATVAGDGNITLSSGNTVITINVTSESGSVRTYTVIAVKAKNTDTTLKLLTVSDGTLTPSFDPTITSYDVEVDAEVEEITVIGLVNNSLSTVAGNGTYTLDTNSKTINIVVTAESGAKTTYVINVQKHFEPSSKIKELIVPEGELIPEFNKNTLNYSVLVPYEVTSLDLSHIVLEDPGATYTVTGNSNFYVGSNTVKIVVTASDNSSVSTYKITVARQTNASNYLKNLEVVGYTINPVFNKETLYYEVVVPADTKTIQIKASKEDMTSTLSGTGYKTLAKDDTTYYVKVTSSSGSIRTYSIRVRRVQEEGNLLLTLNSSVGTINPTFDSSTNTYTITVPEKTTSIDLTGTVSNGAIVTGLGVSTVTCGTQTRTITVTSASGQANVYTINIVRPASTNTDLDALIPSSGTLDPVFDNDTNSYEIEVDDSTSTISFTALLNDADASVSGNDIKALTYGSNIFVITVTAEDTSVKRDITITVKRYKEIAGISTDTDTIDLEVGETETITYTIDPLDTDYQEVEFIIKDEDIISISDGGLITALKDGSTTVTIRSTHNTSLFAIVTVNVFSKKIVSDTLIIERDNITGGSPYVIGVEPKTPVSNFISMFSNNPSTLHIYDNTDTEITDFTKFTGSYMTIKLIVNNVAYDTLTVVVRGDINGDGIVTISDKTSVKNIILGKAEKTFFNVLISDLNLDGNVTVSDSTANKNFILGKTNSLN